MRTAAVKSLRRYGYAHGLLVNGLYRSVLRKKNALLAMLAPAFEP
jgi:hypothetical protein